MTDSEKTNFLAGEIDALLAAVTALVESHPHGTALEAAYASAKRRQDAATISATVSNAFILGQQRMAERLKPLLQPARRARKELGVGV
jgi:hypothetical protein